GQRSADAAAEVAARILRIRPDSETAVPGALRAWAELAVEESPERSLVERVRDAVEARDLGRAQDLVAAGEALAVLIAGPMELAVDRARRLLSLGTRRARDDRDLERYLDRPELSGAVDRLLAPDSGSWALHLRGVGGVGKTMLVRYLASGRYAADRGLPPLGIARVDFDYMTPDYPARRPVELLVQLADELALHTAAVGASDRALSRFRATATSAHEALSGYPAERPEAMTDERVLAAIDDFAGAVRRLLADSDRRLAGVLLILDTCEELAKADAGDPAAPAVSATLAILERIHERAPSVRVLFAGRRPLPERDYLAVRDVGGFTPEEAGRYLDEFCDPPLAAELKDAIIRASPAVDAPGRISPFDLALYGSWADEDPDLTPQRVARGSDAYIEGRIIGRLRDRDVARALPALAVAGRCRVATIAAFGVVEPGTLGMRLAEQEWIDADGDPVTHVAAKPGLAQRLRDYFGAPDRAAAFAAETTRLAGLLRGRIADAPLADTDADELLAALRLSEPAAAAALWDGIAVRAKDERRWNWLFNVTRRVLGEWEEEGAWASTAALRATVLAASIAASRRASASFNARPAWEEVLRSCHEHPDSQAGRILRGRAVLGLLPDIPAGESLGEALNLRPTDHELLAARVDAVHRLLEAGDDESAARTCFSPESGGLFGSRLGAWVLVANARLTAARGSPDAAGRMLADAERWELYGWDDGRESFEWIEPDNDREFFDWIQPDDLLARVRIEWGLIAPPDDRKLAEWETYAADHFGTIDAERLASQCLRIRLARGVVERSVIERWEGIDRYEHGWQPSCSAHDLVPPLFVTLAEAWSALGEPRRALDLLDRRRNAALGTRADETTIRHADAEAIRIARHFRLEDQRALLTRLLYTSAGGPGSLELHDDARRAMAVVLGESWPLTPEMDDAAERPASWHSWWQCQPPDAEVVQLPGWGRGASTELAADIELDLEEMRQLDHPMLPELRERLADWLARPRPAPRIRSADPYRDARVAMRRAALAGEPPQPPPEVPRRLLAEMAFDEAEMLALRLPSAAARLFGYAYDAYRASGDRLGQSRAAESRAALTGEKYPQAPVGPPGASVRASAGPPGPGFPAPSRAGGPGFPAPAGGRRATIIRSGVASAGIVIGAGLLAGLGFLVYNFLASSTLLTGSGTAGEGNAAGSPVAAPAVIAVGVLAVLVVALGTWRVRGLVRGRGLGAYRLGTLGLTAIFHAGGRSGVVGDVRLLADRRPLRTARMASWPRLLLLAWLIALAAALMDMVDLARVPSPFRGGNAEPGYFGEWRRSAGALELSWTGDHRPVTGGTDGTGGTRRWRGTTSGVIHTERDTAALPWERALAASLDPRVAGRIAWCRRMYVSPGSSPENRGRGVVRYTASAGWLDALGAHVATADDARGHLAIGRAIRTSAGSGIDLTYGIDVGDEDVRVHCAIGRAIRTKAGPGIDLTYGLDVTGEWGRPSTDRAELTEGRPSVVVLQAEPVADEVEAEEGDDLPEKLELAVDLMDSGTVPAVLIVPAVPVARAREVAGAIAAHAAERRADPRDLQRKVREVLGRHVAPAVLDDVVLFVNVRTMDGRARRGW
ncbi:MAG: ATP-binding protein, partial [Nocardiopsaceae bacterium]|nr:ATP-binding protein [Nocardiopsaceae bacterium]